MGELNRDETIVNLQGQIDELIAQLENDIRYRHPTAWVDVWLDKQSIEADPKLRDNPEAVVYQLLHTALQSLDDEDINLERLFDEYDFRFRLTIEGTEETLDDVQDDWADQRIAEALEPEDDT